MPNSIDVVAIAGSPAPSSRSAALLALLVRRLEARDVRVRTFALADFEPRDLLLARSDAPALVALLAALREARAVVLATPVYKGVYAGALKTIVDLFAPDALAGKAALGIATGKLEAHGATVTRAFAELFAFFRDAHSLGTLFALDPELELDAQGGLTLAPNAEQRVQGALDALLARLR